MEGINRRDAIMVTAAAGALATMSGVTAAAQGQAFPGASPGNVKRCRRPDYKAFQVSKIVLVVASGVHESPGATVFFERSSQTIYPPVYALWEAAPSAFFEKTPTPFMAWTQFQFTDPVEKIIVHDGGGQFSIPVEMPKAEVKGAGFEYYRVGGGGEGGPNPLIVVVGSRGDTGPKPLILIEARGEGPKPMIPLLKGGS